MQRLIEFYNSLPTPECGKNPSRGCYDCIEYDHCASMKELDKNQIEFEKCKKCGGTVLTVENLLDPSYSCICTDCGESYVVQYDESRHPELEKEPVLPNCEF